MSVTIALIGVALFSAYGNGANDNFKGVANLFGSRTTDHRRALWWATGTTLLGSCAAVLLSGSLVRAFSGKQLVPEVLTNGLRFLLAVGLGAAMMVMLATHALTGALVGAGLMAIGSVHLARLGTSFFLPLGLSPLLSLLLVAGAYPALRAARLRMGVERQMCLCIGGEEPEPVQLQVGGDAVLQSSGLTIGVGQMESCMERYQGRFIGVDAQWILGRLHFLSAVAVGFARGLNDVTKIVALLITASGLGVSLGSSLLAVGVGMSIGWLLNARRVVVTPSHEITRMNHGQGFLANLVTVFLVVITSCWGVPVFTTHVSRSSLFGLGIATHQGKRRTIHAILASWLITLPLSAMLPAIVFGLS